jgi:hypothetical protein
MSKEQFYKCAFKHCQHESCEIPQDEAVKVGSRYMHEDCAKINENIASIRDLYYEKISNTVVVKQLVSVINSIIFKKNIDSDYLLFALNHAISAKIPIKSPYGLHYLIDNQRIKDLWNKKDTQIKAKKIREEAEELADIKINSTFSYTNSNNVGFGGIFKGGK